MTVFGGVLVSVLAKEMILLVLAAAIARQIQSAALRHQIWLVSILGFWGLLLCEILALVLFVPTFVLPIPTPVPWRPAPASSALQPDVATASFPSGQELMFLWALVGGFLLFLLLVGTLQRWRLVRQCRPIGDPLWAELLNDCGEKVGVRRRPRLLLGPTDATPMTWGTWRPHILLPERAGEWSEKHRRDVLLHELSHIQRRDHLSWRLVQLTRALSWPNPLLWWAARQLRMESEIACDDRVLQTGARPSGYANHLLAEFVDSRSYRPRSWIQPPSLGMARESSLETRIDRILDKTVHRQPLAPGRRGLATFAAVAILVPAALVAPGFVEGEGLDSTILEESQRHLRSPWSSKLAGLSELTRKSCCGPGSADIYWDGFEQAEATAWLSVYTGKPTAYTVVAKFPDSKTQARSQEPLHIITCIGGPTQEPVWGPSQSLCFKSWRR
ncbi:MAG: M56 family metallopeptidase [Deltaproteobacteria bacterium]|nr:M56 family metallopeptidase [Deltaproteobacteria bacterium]